LLEKKGGVLVTGASGFLGSWLCHYLSFIGYEVFAVTRPGSNISRLHSFPESLVFSDEVLNWPSLIGSLRPRIVIAADWSGVDSASRNSLDVQLRNVIRIKMLADASVENGVETFITFGSQAENGPINIPASELNYDKATSTYGKVKIELRKMLDKNLRETNTRFIWGRIFSTYGALDNTNWFLPSIINSLLDNKPFSLTSGDQFWSYLHAYDFCVAVKELLEADTVQGVVNIGNEDAVKIRDIADCVGQILDKKSMLSFGATEYRNDQVMLLQPVTSKLNCLGWKPSINFYSGLEDLVHWHRVGTGKFTIENLFRL
jgi:nucleoside-diphosphate-sugar epimerase